MEEQKVPAVTEARRGIQWASRGVYDILQQPAET